MNEKNTFWLPFNLTFGTVKRSTSAKLFQCAQSYAIGAQVENAFQ